MLSLLPGTEIYLVAGATDMRKSFNGLSAIVENVLEQSALGGQVFVFCNRRRNRLKLIFFDGSGLWVCAKRLERGTFAWPRVREASVELSPEELALLLGGIDLAETTRRPWYKRAAEA